MNKMDRFIIMRMSTITLLVLFLLIAIFIIIDFSENSDDFTDRGATLGQIWNDYYLNYIPEIIRLVTPLAVFTACLLLTGRMAQRLELVALKAAGVSVYRILRPFLLYAVVCAGIVSYLDGYIVPKSNEARFDFERKYIMSSSDRVDRNKIYRQESPNTLLSVNYYAPTDQIGYRVTLYTFENNRVVSALDAGRMEWDPENRRWFLYNVTKRTLSEEGVSRFESSRMDTTLTILPRDLARTTSDVFQLTYPEIRDYIASLERIGASEIELPKVQYYGKLSYSFSIIVLTILGVSIASVKRSSGTGFILGVGLAVSFLYLAFMKLIEPFGIAGAIDPMWTALTPHLFFFVVSLIVLIRTPK